MMKRDSTFDLMKSQPDLQVEGEHAWTTCACNANAKTTAGGFTTFESDSSPDEMHRINFVTISA